MTDTINFSELLERVPNKFLLSVAASKRARQIKENMQHGSVLDEVVIVPVVEALKEIARGDIIVTLKYVDETKAQLGIPVPKSATANSDQAVSDDASKDKKTKESRSKSKNKSLAA